MEAVDLLAGAGAWTALALFTTVLAHPLLRAAGRADEMLVPSPPEPPVRLAPVPGPVPSERIPSLVESGYVRIVPDRLAAQLQTMLAADQAQIHARDPSDPSSLIVVAACGTAAGVVGSRIPANHGAVGMALQSGQPAVAPGTPATAAPVAREGRIAGVVSATAGDPVRAFSLEDLELLCEVAGLAGGALERPGERRALERTADAQVRSLAAAMKLWDRATGRHSMEVVGLARKCGELLGLSTPELLEVELGALLHDIGKIRVPRELLNRPGPLSEEDRQTMRLHPAWGAELVARIPGMAAVAVIVRHHHERIDGSGYPAGLTGERIPLAARIVGVADAYAAMTSGRPYRAAIPVANAIEELSVHAGEQFDRRAVDALADAVGDRGVVVPLAHPVRV